MSCFLTILCGLFVSYHQPILLNCFSFKMTPIFKAFIYKKSQLYYILQMFIPPPSTSWLKKAPTPIKQAFLWLTIRTIKSDDYQGWQFKWTEGYEWGESTWDDGREKNGRSRIQGSHRWEKLGKVWHWVWVGIEKQKDQIFMHDCPANWIRPPIFDESQSVEYLNIVYSVQQNSFVCFSFFHGVLICVCSIQKMWKWWELPGCLHVEYWWFGWKFREIWLWKFHDWVGKR